MAVYVIDGAIAEVFLTITYSEMADLVLALTGTDLQHVDQEDVVNYFDTLSFEVAGPIGEIVINKVREYTFQQYLDDLV